MTNQYKSAIEELNHLDMIPILCKAWQEINDNPSTNNLISLYLLINEMCKHCNNKGADYAAMELFFLLNLLPKRFLQSEQDHMERNREEDGNVIDLSKYNRNVKPILH